MYGLEVAVPTTVAPCRNSTCVMAAPAAAVALAVIATVAGAVYVAPLAGVVIATVGGWAGPTVTVTGGEKAMPPALSVATARTE